MQEHSNIKVRKISNTDFNFSTGIEPMYSEWRRGDRKINQVIYFNFEERLWKSEHVQRV